MTVTLKRLDGGTNQIGTDAIDALGARLQGEVIRPGGPGYDEARTLWNGMIDRRPGLVIRARTTGDIRAAVDFARSNDLLIAIRGGGHQIAGFAAADGALQLDLSQMRAVAVDPASATVRVEPGATLADLDRETQAHGLAVPTGINSTTGIAGLTLGGGFGWITRKFGMTVDNLISADVVTADGELRRASATENPDLFWALRGGGGNFGVVAVFEFRAHRLGPEVLSGLIVHPIEAAPELLRALRPIWAEAPDELTVWAVLRLAPPVPFIPEDWHGKPIIAIAVCYAGSLEDGEKATAGLRALGNPVVDVVSPHPYSGWQQALDPLLAPGARNYWKSHDFTDISDAAIDAIFAAAARIPDPQTEIALAHVGGAMARVPADATAFPQRAAHLTMNLHTRWEDPAKDRACIGWARDLFDATTPYAAPSIYVNFIPEEGEPDQIVAAYGDNLARLREIKARYDPENRFRMNHNIEPAPATVAAK